ncbi:hypothetical protein FRC19_004433 [Serendipita sp. 401]|nr:hypothetical protein FRC19_004433 [Serendipita sp. 401]KAG9031542.1 hypothetical protein FS842_004242 [Serendipita sp. 407]
MTIYARQDRTFLFATLHRVLSKLFGGSTNNSERCPTTEEASTTQKQCFSPSTPTRISQVVTRKRIAIERGQKERLASTVTIHYRRHEQQRRILQCTYLAFLCVFQL